MVPLNAPTFFLWPVRFLAWLLWRNPVAKPEPTPPKPFRKPVLAYTIGDIPTELMAVIRIEWLKGNGSASEVEEYQIEECPDAQASRSAPMPRRSSATWWAPLCGKGLTCAY
jgi:hypothetical protein